MDYTITCKSMPSVIPIIEESKPGVTDFAFPRHQRKVRKKRRRANAAGYKGAFTGAIRAGHWAFRSKYRRHVGKKQRAKIAKRLDAELYAEIPEAI